jgi:hypothetical protein
MLKAICTFIAAVTILPLTGLCADADSADSAKSRLLEEPILFRNCPVFTRLLTWDDKKDEAENKEDGDKDGGEGQGEEDKEQPLDSDRPGFTNSTDTVGYRRLQIEGGYKYTQAVEGDRTHNAHDLPELLVRYGLAERLELRVAWDEGVVLDQSTDRSTGRLASQSGVTDMDAGFKYALSQQKKWLPQSALTVMVSAPVGSPDQTSGQADVEISYLYSWEITKKLTLVGATSDSWTADPGDRFSQFLQAASLDYELAEKLHMFNELAGILNRDRDDSRPQFYYDAGCTYHVTPNFQLDWSAGVGLNEAADGFFTGWGMAIRK